MPPKTLSKPTSAEAAGPSGPVAAELPAALAETVGALAADRAKLAQLAEQVLLAHAATIPGAVNSVTIRAHFSPDELSLFDQLNWDGRTLATEAGRASQLATWQAQAGTSTDRELAQQASDEAAAKLAEQSPEFEAQYARARAAQAALEHAADDARRIVERQRVAVENLRKLAPPCVKDDHARALAAIQPIRSEQAALRTALHNAAACAACNIATSEGKQAARLIAHVQAPHTLHDRAIEGVQPAAWKAFVDALVRDVPQLEQHAEVLAKRISQAERQAEKILDHYAR
jgi:hypothetical protein